jgi:predicted transcriptional regulator
MADDEINMTIRLTPELHARLGRAAMRERRSKHAQMLVLIERGLDQDERKQKRAARLAASSGEDHVGTQEH